MKNKKLQEALKETFGEVTQTDIEQKFIQIYKAKRLHNSLKRAVSVSLEDWARATIPRSVETQVVNWSVEFYGNEEDDPDGKYLFYITTDCNGEEGLETLDIKKFLDTDWKAERIKREKEDIEHLREHAKFVIEKMAKSVGLEVVISKMSEEL